MHKSFYSILFVGLIGYGVWLEQSYMGVYSQEFELQQSANRANAPYLLAKNLDMKEYKNGIFTNHFRTNEVRFLNNGQVAAHGKMRYASVNDDGSPALTISAPRMIALLKSSEQTQGKNSLRLASDLAWVSFPNEVVAVSKDDHINGSNVLFTPESQIVESRETITWNGANRHFEGRGFRYNMNTEDLSVGGPISGTFLPNKDDFSSFGKRR
jgi:hypothetical protein